MNSGNNPTLDHQVVSLADIVLKSHQTMLLLILEKTDIIFPGRMGPNSERDPAMDTQAGI